MARPNSSTVLFDTVAILGVGLIGGSFGMAARRRGIARRVIGIGRTEQKLMRAKILGAIDEYTLDIENGASEADLLVLCTPVRLVAPTLARMADSLKEGAIVTDAGSTKREIVAGCEAVIPEGRFFVGGHPMAGSEQTGVDVARADLFVDATYVLTPGASTDLAALGRMTEFAGALGARVEILSPDEHDAAVATISHLPHAIAGALMQLAEDSQRRTGKTFALAAGAFRDMTRIAGSSPELWRDICLTNADSLSQAVSALQALLDGFRDALESRDEAGIQRFFEQSRQIRETYLRITQ